jgi:hypothetical protein
MANITNALLTPGTQLTTSPVVYYTSPVATSTLLKKLTLSNTTAGPITAQVYLVPSAGSPVAANNILPTTTVGALSTLEVYIAENQVIPTGGTLQAAASAATSLTIFASGIQILN